jgi:hypothetical protein
MSFPNTSSIEMPILQELAATGGEDDVRFLYERLEAYFPQLSADEIAEIRSGESKIWRRFVQKAGKTLDEKNYIKRDRGIWKITEKGKQTVEADNQGFVLKQLTEEPLSHANIQSKLVEIGQTLGFYAETEFEFYDVIWRETSKSQRISHVFEVQSKGNIDSAFAKLKRAYQAQRSKPFLILSTETDTRRALKSLNSEFLDIQEALTILSFPEIKKIHENLHNIADFLPAFLRI